MGGADDAAPGTDGASRRRRNLDGPAEALSNAYSAAVKPGRLKDALSGTWLGHTLHPCLTDATTAFFVSASPAVTHIDPYLADAAKREARLI